MVITLDKNKRPLGFMSERRCRILLEKKTCSPVSLLSDYVKDMQAQKGPAKQAEQANKQAGNQAEAAAQTTSAENANTIPA